MPTMAREHSKEAAYLYDLYVAGDWGERFALLLEEKSTLPAEGGVLYLGAGTGGHVLALRENLSAEAGLVAVDADADKIALARPKGEAIRAKVEFKTAELTELPFGDNGFAAVLCEASMLAPAAVPDVVKEMSRVAERDATLSLTTVTAGSYGEVISLIWEAMYCAGLLIYEDYAVELVNENLTTGRLAELAQQAGWRNVATETHTETFDFANAEEFFLAPLITHFLMPHWMAGLNGDAGAAERFDRELRAVYAENANDVEFRFSVKATIVTGKK